MADCPADGDLICLASGELSSEASRNIKRHLDRCSSCQANLRELVEAFQASAIVVAEDEALRDEGLRQYSEFRRALYVRARSEPQRSPTFTRLLLVAAVLLAAVLPVVVTRATRYDAGVVVQRAVDHESSEALGGEADEPLRFYWVAEDKAANVGVQGAASAKTSRRGLSPTQEVTEPTREIVVLLDSHGFNRREPLSASRLAAWRSALSAHGERVIQRDGLLYVRTIVPHGQLREVVVVVRRDDWRIVGLAWVFSGLGQLQVERLGSDAFSSMPQSGASRKEGAAQ